MTTGPDAFDHVAISASAGTGKTFALTNRYIALCAAGEAPDRILATTFTRKAAGEIQQRVLKRLAAATLDPGSLAELRRFIDADLTHERCAGLLAKLVHTIHRMRIGTLDSLFVGMAQAFALDLGLPSGWTISDHTQERQMRADAIADVLAGSPTPRLVSLMRMLHHDTSGAAVTDQIDRTVSGMHELYMQSPAEAVWCWLQPEPPDHAAVQRATEALGAAALPTTQQGKTRANYARAIGTITAAANARDWAMLFDQKLVQRVVSGQVKFDGVEIPEPIAALIHALAEQGRRVIARRLADQNAAAHALLSRFDDAFRRRQGDRRMLRFADVTQRLADESLTAALSEVYYRLDGMISHLLLDEFQDTSLLQWRVLEPMAVELTSDQSRSRSFFCVGDRKQAIYGWRGGEARIFDSLADVLPAPLATREQHESHRSSPVIMQTVNDVFTNLASNPAVESCRAAIAAWTGDFPEHRTADRKAHLAGYAELRVTAGPGDDAPPLVVTCEGAAELIRSRRDAWSGMSVGVLTRTNKAVARMIYELARPRADASGRPMPAIAASEEGGNPLTDSPAVSCVLSLLRVADHPGDRAARYHVAIAPLGAIVGLTDHTDDAAARRVSHRLRRQLAAEGYGQTLFGLVADLAGVCDRRNASRLLQLVEVGHDYDARATLRPRDFVHHVRDTRVEDPTAAPVRVMTIHQAKGLEFDVVVLPELGGSITGSSPSVLVDRPAPLAPIERVSHCPRQHWRALIDPLPRMHDQWLARSVADSMSTLYVALTRAKHALHMMVAPAQSGDRRDSYARLLAGALRPGEPPVEPGVAWSAGRADWYAAVTRDERAVETVTVPEVRLSRADHGRNRILPHRSPSSLSETEAVDLRRHLTLEGAGAKSRGSIVHAWCELIEWMEDGLPPRERLLDRVKASAVRGHDLDALARQFERMVRAPDVAAALRRDGYPPGSELGVQRERRFVVRDGERLLQGMFDRLVIISAGGAVVGAEVIDFKTDRGVDRLDELVEHYRPQLAAYRRAAATLYGLDESAVRAKLVFLAAGAVRDVL